MHPLKAAGAVALVSLMLAGWAAFPAADLLIADLAVDPYAPLPGARVLFTATVENVGDEDAEDQFFVRFEIDGTLIGNPAVSGGLRSGQRKPVTASWIAEPGLHSIVAEADRPFDRIPEFDESNNEAQSEVVVPSSAEISNRLSGLRVAVGPFEDRSGSRLVNVESGIAEKLGERLSDCGVRTIEAGEVEDVMRQRDLNPYALDDVGVAAEELGADVLIVGSVAGIQMFESTLSLGVVSLGGGSAEVSLAASVVDLPAIDPLFDVSADGHYEGTTELSLDLGVFLSQPGTVDVCAGGLQTDREAYYGGDLVSIGYTNAGSAAWYSAEIHTATGTFVRWLGWQYTANGSCGRWFWDQRDSFDAQVPASVYTVKVWDGLSYVASKTFQIRPGVSLFPLVDEITVGSQSFEDSIVGEAMTRAVDRLAAELVDSLEEIAPRVANESAEPARREAMLGSPAEEGQVAAILPNGRIVITLGALAGVTQGDHYVVIASGTSEIRGEIVIVEVRDDVSYALRTTGDDPAVGDIVRAIQP